MTSIVRLSFTHYTRNDILRKHKIIPEKPPSPTPMIEEALTEARRLAHENRLEGKELDELAALEDEEDEDFLEFYRYISISLCHLSCLTSSQSEANERARRHPVGFRLQSGLPSTEA